MVRKITLLAVAMAVVLGIGVAQAAETVKIGAVAPKTGPLAAGAATTHWPNIKLWAAEVNAKGGLKVKNGGQRMVQIIEYDDQTNPGETIKAVTRLATQDKVDFIISPYGTGLSLAVAPVFAKFGYPQITTTSITDQTGELTKRYSGIFFTLGTTTAFAGSVSKILKKMRAEGKIGSNVAMVNVADAFGIELMGSALPIFKADGFNIVYQKSYPLGTQDLSPIMKGAKATNPDAFVAWSYPPDTFGLTQEAKIQNLNVKAFYTAVATSFPVYMGKFGKGTVEGVLGAGGVNPDYPPFKKYAAAHLKITGQAPNFWASAVVYASLQVLEQSIAAVGLSRKAVTAHIKKAKFNTVMGPWKFKNQVIQNYWTVGQWQDGNFNGVASTGMPGEKAPAAKTGW